VKGFNALTGSRVKLGRWEEYLAMRRGILKLNQDFRDLIIERSRRHRVLLFDL